MPNPGHVDHDHLSGRVRGMLCFTCNQALGNVRDDVRVLRAFAHYLSKSRGISHRTRYEEFRPAPGVVIEVDYRRHAA
jgi:Recombination endonuclease VII